MFHKSNLGSYGSLLPSDIHGYVAEEGDSWEDFVFENTPGWEDEDWEIWFEEKFLPRCIEATREANKALSEWQKNQ